MIPRERKRYGSICYAMGFFLNFFLSSFLISLFVGKRVKSTESETSNHVVGNLDVCGGSLWMGHV